LKWELLLWYCVGQLTFNGIKGLWFIIRHLCNTSQEGIIGELILRCFEVAVREEFKDAARVANPDLGGRDGLSLLLG